MKNKLSKRLADAFNRLRRPRAAGPLPPKKYYASLPRKRSSAGMLFLQDGKVLVEELTYQKTLGMPGGVVDGNESPLDAALRECREELGVAAKATALLCVDYCHDNGIKGDTIGFVFLGDMGAQTPQPDGKEIRRLKWLPPAEAIAALDPRAGRRLALALQALKENRIIYSEDGQEPAALAPPQQGGRHGIPRP